MREHNCSPKSLYKMEIKFWEFVTDISDCYNELYRQKGVHETHEVKRLPGCGRAVPLSAQAHAQCPTGAFALAVPYEHVHGAPRACNACRCMHNALVGMCTMPLQTHTTPLPVKARMQHHAGNRGYGHACNTTWALAGARRTLQACT